MRSVEEQFRTGQDTEEAGARYAARNAESIKTTIVRLLKERWMTDDELEVDWERRYGLPDRRFFGNTLRRRRHELKVAGKVVDTGLRRKSRCGVLNIVWGVPE